MPMGSKLEDVFQTLYKFFLSSPKHHLEFTKLVENVETKRLKVFFKIRKQDGSTCTMS